MAKACEVILYEEDGWTPEKIKVVIASKQTIREYAFILHDKDIDDKGEAVKSHFHVYLSFGNNSAQFTHIATWFGVEENHVQRIKGSRKSMLMYLYHGNAPGKHQYAVEEIESNFDVGKCLARIINKENLDQLIEKCASGEITPYNYPQHIPATLYARHKPKFENAWKYYEDSLAVNNGAGRQLKVIWMYGKSGTGKTTLAKLYAIRANEAIYVTSQGQYPFDGYAAQPICLIDELRPDEPFSFVELLQLLDPYTRRELGARYRNKQPLYRTLFIASALSPEDFIKQSSIQNEEAYQLYRRISGVWHVCRDYIEIFVFEQGNSVRHLRDRWDNPIQSYLSEHSCTALSSADEILDIRAELGCISQMDAPQFVELEDNDGAENPFLQ